MKIIKPGDSEIMNKLLSFTCEFCGCEFKADRMCADIKHEEEVQQRQQTHQFINPLNPIYSCENARVNRKLYAISYCDCPECGRKCFKRVDKN